LVQKPSKNTIKGYTKFMPLAFYDFCNYAKAIKNVFLAPQT
jgi:hypothetical protein